MNPEPTSIINPENFAPARFGNINSLLDLIIPLLFSFIALVALVVLVYGSYTFMTAAGDHSKIEKAQRTFQMLALGVTLVFVSFLIVRVIAYITEIPFLL